MSEDQDWSVWQEGCPWRATSSTGKDDIFFLFFWFGKSRGRDDFFFFFFFFGFGWSQGCDNFFFFDTQAHTSNGHNFATAIPVHAISDADDGDATLLRQQHRIRGRRNPEMYIVR